MTAKTELEVGGKKLKVSNSDKVLFPAVGFTKANLIDYYIRISPNVLPHLKNRPLTLKRFPDGIHGEYFYEKSDPDLFAFTPQQAIKRCQKLGDLFESVLKLKQKLPTGLLEALASIKAPEREPAAPKRRAKAKDLTLAGYKAKRDFTQTAEPPPKLSPARKGSSKRLFVIQKHQASHLHYDFRLEMDGVLKSWAVPKGPPYERSEKRLAMPVEDHPMEYARFEGTIASGNYGAGTVMVWDIGTYDLLDGNVYAGKLHLLLHGKKLKGEWILVRASRGEEEKRPWFLIKGGTSMERLPPKQDDRSALSGRSLAQIARDNDAQWKSNR